MPTEFTESQANTAVTALHVLVGAMADCGLTDAQIKKALQPKMVKVAIEQIRGKGESNAD